MNYPSNISVYPVRWRRLPEEPEREFLSVSVEQVGGIKFRFHIDDDEPERVEQLRSELASSLEVVKDFQRRQGQK